METVAPKKFRLVLLKNILGLLQTNVNERRIIFDRDVCKEDKRSVTTITHSFNIRREIVLNYEEERNIVVSILKVMVKDHSITLNGVIVSKKEIKIKKVISNQHTNMLNAKERSSNNGARLDTNQNTLKTCAPVSNRQENITYDTITKDEILETEFNFENVRCSYYKRKDLGLRLVILNKILEFFESYDGIKEIIFYDNVKLNPRIISFLDTIVYYINVRNGKSLSTKIETNIFWEILDSAEEDGNDLDISYHSSLRKMRLFKLPPCKKYIKRKLFQKLAKADVNSNTKEENKLNVNQSMNSGAVDVDKICKKDKTDPCESMSKVKEENRIKYEKKHFRNDIVVKEEIKKERRRNQRNVKNRENLSQISEINN